MSEDNGFAVTFLSPSDSLESQKLPDEDLPLNNTLYLQDKNCIICAAKFKKFKTRRYCCFYCYRGVCNNCSLQKTFNKELSRSVRTCDKCIKEVLCQGNTLEIEKVNALKNKIFERIKEEQSEISRNRGDSTYLKENHTYIEAEILARTSSIAETKLKIEAKRNENKNLMEKLKMLEDECIAGAPIKSYARSQSELNKGDSEKYNYLKKKLENLKFENKSLSLVLKKTIESYNACLAKRNEIAERDRILAQMISTKETAY
mmetsp:Transcript_14097/g.14157  ORF Transcript_14097/g.14157 Transcript_14097/m.14157 type:complete len:260 (-) Transcript_14097:3-782(-)